MTMTGASVEEAIRSYMSGLSEKERADQQADLMKFSRYLGSGVRLDSLKAEDVERYQEQFERTGADNHRLEAVRAFLTKAHKDKITDFNLGKFIRIKRSSSKKASKNGSDQQVIEDDVAHITRDGYDTMKQELDHLVNVKRAEIANDLYEARIDKDFRENAPYDAAKQHQAEVEARIRYLERTLATAEIVEQSGKKNRVGLGSTVLLRDMTHEEELVYTLVGTSEANPRLGRISVASPVGKAILDRRPGEEFTVDAPVGAIRYRVERIEA